MKPVSSAESSEDEVVHIRATKPGDKKLNVQLPGQRLTTHAIAPTNLRQRLSAFLPQFEQANNELSASDRSKMDIELDECSSSSSSSEDEQDDDADDESSQEEAEEKVVIDVSLLREGAPDKDATDTLPTAWKQDAEISEPKKLVEEVAECEQ